MSLRYQGHEFVGDGARCFCCVQDRKALNDPTGTRGLRSRMRATLRLRWNAMRIHTRDIILTHDLLQLSGGGLIPVKAPATQMGANKVQAFQRWFDHALQADVLGGDGSLMQPFIRSAYQDGVSYASAQLGRRIMSGQAQHREDTLFQLAVVELQGIIEAVSQQAVREVANGLLLNMKPMAIVRKIWDRIDKIGVTRTSVMCDLMVVKAFNDATLDCYEAAGVKSVGIIAEAIVKPKIADAARKGPGSRISRRRPPSKRTIQRIRAVAQAQEQLKKVNIRTAGDDDVCPVCEAIAEDGPYLIDTARSLIPAHPRCRCAFIPFGDARFARDFNPWHVPSGPHGGEFAQAAAHAGNAGEGGRTTLILKIARTKQSVSSATEEHSLTSGEILFLKRLRKIPK